MPENEPVDLIVKMSILATNARGFGVTLNLANAYDGVSKQFLAIVEKHLLAAWQAIHDEATSTLGRPTPPITASTK